MGTAVRALLYLVLYCAFAQPRAAFWRLYAVTATVIYACTGMAYLLSQVLFNHPPPSPPTSILIHACVALPAASTLMHSESYLWLAANGMRQKLFNRWYTALSLHFVWMDRYGLRNL